MGPKFFQTIMGQRFFERTVPSVLAQVERLNDNLERLNNNLEKLFEEKVDDKTEGEVE
jgi:hypothetical protein